MNSHDGVLGEPEQRYFLKIQENVFEILLGKLIEIVDGERDLRLPKVACIFSESKNDIVLDVLYQFLSSLCFNLSGEVTVIQRLLRLILLLQIDVVFAFHLFDFAQ